MIGKNNINKGFTLIELLIVVAIIGILAAVGASVIPGLLTNAKVNCANQSHQQIWENLKVRLMTCSTGINVTYGPFANRIPNTRTLNCSLVHPSGYPHYHSADSHAYSMYLESQLWCLGFQVTRELHINRQSYKRLKRFRINNF